MKILKDSYAIESTRPIRESMAAFQKELDESAERLAEKKAARAAYPPQPTLAEIMAAIQQLMNQVGAMAQASGSST